MDRSKRLVSPGGVESEVSPLPCGGRVTSGGEGRSEDEREATIVTVGTGQSRVGRLTHHAYTYSAAPRGGRE